MQSLAILNKRNKLLFISFAIGLTHHNISILLDFFEYRYYYPWIATSYAVIVGLLFYFKIHPKTMQIILLVGMNSLIVLLIEQSIYIISLYWLIFFLFLVTTYKSIFLNTIFSIIVTLEASIIIAQRWTADQIPTPETMLSLFLFTAIHLCTVGIIQSFYVKSLWGHEEKKTIAKENHLTSKEAYLRLFFEHANDAIAVVGFDKNIIEVNPAYEELYGWTREESIGKNPPVVPPHNIEAAAERFNALLRGESFTLIETEEMRKDGTVFDAQISLSPIFDTYGEIIAVSVISRDISYIKENKRLLLQSEKLRLAGEIAAGVAHEIRNPMTVISGFVQMMNDDTSSPYQIYTNIIQKEIERIDLILAEFLVLSKPQVDNYAEIQVIHILADISNLFHLEFQQRNIELVLPDKLSTAKILGNENQIKQVLINTVKNAMEAIGENGIVQIQTYTEKDQLHINIHDSGCGIPPHLLERIFEPFYTTKTKGTGLGMMIINKIIQDHQGSIKIQSKLKIGTEISICLPIITEKAANQD